MTGTELSLVLQDQAFDDVGAFPCHFLLITKRSQMALKHLNESGSPC